MAYGQIAMDRDTEGKMVDVISVKMKGGVKLYKGGLAGIGAGYATFMQASVANMPFLGVVRKTTDNTTAATDGADGSAEVRIDTAGAHVMKGTGLAQTDLLKEVYVDYGASSDNATITTSAPANFACKVGRIVEVISATKCRVNITGYANVTQGAAS